jgi:uncharacterized protein (TIGR03083 family)
MEPLKPVIVAGLFPEIQAELLVLLKSLTAEDWQKATVCPGWSVKDVALHILGGEIGNLSRRRDGHVLDASINSWDELVRFINEWNENWVSVARRISPRLLIDLLALTGEQMGAYFQELDPFALGGAVSWVGDEPAPVWLDLAREYTERWHHQQHIRDAVDQPGLKQPKYLSPILASFVRALPRTYRTTLADENTAVTVSITGEAGGRWSVVRENGTWNIYAGAPAAPAAEVILDQDLAWRLFTRGIDAELARAQMVFKGDTGLGFKVLEMVSIIA